MKRKLLAASVGIILAPLLLSVGVYLQLKLTWFGDFIRAGNEGTTDDLVRKFGDPIEATGQAMFLPVGGQPNRCRHRRGYRTVVVENFKLGFEYCYRPANSGNELGLVGQNFGHCGGLRVRACRLRDHESVRYLEENSGTRR